MAGSFSWKVLLGQVFLLFFFLSDYSYPNKLEWGRGGVGVEGTDVVVFASPVPTFLA